MSSKTYNVYGITSIVAISGFMIGLESSSLTAFLTCPQFISYFGKLDKWDHGLIASSNSIGAVAGCIVCGAFCDALGCIRTFQASSLMWALGSVVVFLSKYIYVVVVGRVMKGFAIGLISAVIPIYVSETFPNNKKGLSMSLVLLSSTFGSISMYCLGYFFQKYLKNENSFKYSWLIASSPAVFLLSLGFFLPESPKWLASHNKWHEAAKNLDRVKTIKKTKGKPKPNNRYNIGDKEYVIQAYTSGSEIKISSYSALFGKKYWRYTCIGIFTQVLVQLASINALMYFSVYLCGICGLREDRRLFIVTIQYIVLSVFTFFPVFLLDTCRRIDSLVFGMFLLGVSFAAINIIAAVHHQPAEFTENDSTFPLDWRLSGTAASSVLALFLFLISLYSSTIVSAGWLYTGEIFPGQARSKGTSVCMCASWIINAILLMNLPIIMKTLKYWTFGILSVFCLIGSIVFSQFPETRDLSEIEIEYLYSTENHSLSRNKLKTIHEKQRKHTNGREVNYNSDQVSPQNQQLNNMDYVEEDKKIYEEIKTSAKQLSSNERREESSSESKSDIVSNDRITGPRASTDKSSSDPYPRSNTTGSTCQSSETASIIHSSDIIVTSDSGDDKIEDVLEAYTGDGDNSESNNNTSLDDSFYSDSWFESKAPNHIIKVDNASERGPPSNYSSDSNDATSLSSDKISPNRKRNFKSYNPASYLNFDTLKVKSKGNKHKMKEHDNKTEYFGKSPGGKISAVRHSPLNAVKSHGQDRSNGRAKLNH
ncbi:Piso0_005629 [Millerozyma farinosa CBS 7064]|uniref:Piso0_005629 protein n=1 Tax=Pichia sorbitophila (strain ATCC MYA-4447 / BCRC 22081 / CBS 7064 / NBRC 10061 / NRRL Y-12695) TaxID=559304 RepID=G8Y2H6_PICSO|nr:Piso0_005629 [Millerozyma farinosa CBS 7064]